MIIDAGSYKFCTICNSDIGHHWLNGTDKLTGVGKIVTSGWILTWCHRRVTKTVTNLIRFFMVNVRVLEHIQSAQKQSSCANLIAISRVRRMSATGQWTSTQFPITIWLVSWTAIILLPGVTDVVYIIIHRIWHLSFHNTQFQHLHAYAAGVGCHIHGFLELLSK